MDNTDAALAILNNPASSDEEKAFASKIIDGATPVPSKGDSATGEASAPAITDEMLKNLRAEFLANSASPRPPSADELKFRARQARLEEVCAEIAKHNPNDLNFGNPRYIAALEFNVLVWGGQSRMTREQLEYVYGDTEGWDKKRLTVHAA